VLLALDVGNSNTLCGIYERDSPALRTSFRLSTDRDRMPDEWLALLTTMLAADGMRLGEFDAVIISSVVPGVTTWLLEMSRQRLRLEPVVVSAALDLGLRLRVGEPDKLGADRIVDCVAAFARYGGPAVVIDLGTATTVDVVSAEGDYLGGVIAAGIGTSLGALATNAAQLFNVELLLPDRTVGTTTVEQLRSGIVLGHLLMLEGIVGRIREEIRVAAPTVLTGGLAPLLAGKSPSFDHHDPNLTIDGLWMIHARVVGVPRP
jgi:type III pantothenate kinase